MMPRQATTELLDTLPPESAEAQRGRRDLELINHLMGNWRWLRRTLPGVVLPGDGLIEIGAGSGGSARALRAAVGPDTRITGLDVIPRPQSWPENWDWIEHDILSFNDLHNFDVVVANLVLHHFEAPGLATIGARLRSRARVLVACEPARRRVHTWQARALGVLGVNHITRNDAPASVRAGFRDGELPELLGLSHREWTIRIDTTLLGAYRLVAMRRAP